MNFKIALSFDKFAEPFDALENHGIEDAAVFVQMACFERISLKAAVLADGSYSLRLNFDVCDQVDIVQHRYANKHHHVTQFLNFPKDLQWVVQVTNNYQSPVTMRSK